MDSANNNGSYGTLIFSWQYYSIFAGGSNISGKLFAEQLGSTSSVQMLRLISSSSKPNSPCRSAVRAHGTRRSYSEYSAPKSTDNWRFQGTYQETNALEREHRQTSTARKTHQRAQHRQYGCKWYTALLQLSQGPTPADQARRGPAAGPARQRPRAAPRRPARHEPSHLAVASCGCFLPWPQPHTPT